MGLDDTLKELEGRIKKLQRLRESLGNVEEKKELDGSIIKLKREYDGLSEKYKNSYPK